MTLDEHLAAIREAINAAVADDALSRGDLRQAIEETQNDCETILGGLDYDDEQDAITDDEEQRNNEEGDE